jgi:hypothetical protein
MNQEPNSAFGLRSLFEFAIAERRYVRVTLNSGDQVLCLPYEIIQQNQYDIVVGGRADENGYVPDSMDSILGFALRWVIDAELLNMTYREPGNDM